MGLFLLFANNYKRNANSHRMCPLKAECNGRSSREKMYMRDFAWDF